MYNIQFPFPWKIRNPIEMVDACPLFCDQDPPYDRDGCVPHRQWPQHVLALQFLL